MLFIYTAEFGDYDIEPTYRIIEKPNIEAMREHLITELRKDSDYMDMNNRKEKAFVEFNELTILFNVGGRASLDDEEIVYLTDKELEELKAYNLQKEIERKVSDEKYLKKKKKRQKEYLKTYDCLCGFGMNPYRRLSQVTMQTLDIDHRKCEKHMTPILIKCNDN